MAFRSRRLDTNFRLRLQLGSDPAVNRCSAAQLQRAGGPTVTKTKRDIVREVSERLNLNQKVAKEAVQLTLDSIIEALRTDGRIELRNFGVFEVKRRRPRTARNPKTGERVPVAEKNVIAFKPGKLMADVVQAAGVLPGGPTAARQPPAAPTQAQTAPPALPVEGSPHWMRPQTENSEPENIEPRSLPGSWEGNSERNE